MLRGDQNVPQKLAVALIMDELERIRLMHLMPEQHSQHTLSRTCIHHQTHRQ